MPETKSQTELILEHLRQGNTITPIEALQKFGCFRLGARIWDLKDAGHTIITETEENEGKRYARYRLTKNAEQGDLFGRTG